MSLYTQSPKQHKKSLGTPTHLVSRFRKKRIKKQALKNGKKLGISNPNKHQLKTLKRIARLDGY